MQTAVRERKEGNKHRFKRAKNLNKGLSQEGTTDRQTDRQRKEREMPLTTYCHQQSKTPQKSAKKGSESAKKASLYGKSTQR